VSSLPQAGSAFPVPAPKTEPTPAPTVTDGKFAAFVGSYDGGQMGVLVVTQEDEKLFALAPGSERVELVPETTADSFIAQPVGSAVRFEREATNKVTGIIVTLPNGRVIKGRKTQSQN